MKRKLKSQTPDQIKSIVKSSIKAGIAEQAELVRSRMEPLPDSAEGLIQRAFAAQAAMGDVIKALKRASDQDSIPMSMQRAAWLNINHAVRDGVSTMNRLALERPDVFGFAEKECYWPVLKSPGVGFLKGEPQERELFTKLGVGNKLEICIVRTKWRANDPVGKLAVDLYGRVRNGWLFDHPLDQDDPEETHMAAQHFRDRAKRLPPFLQDGVWPKWLNLAKEIFERRWKDQTDREQLSRLITSQSKRKSPGRMKARLWEMITERFKSMAGEKHQPGR